MRRFLSEVDAFWLHMLSQLFRDQKASIEKHSASQEPRQKKQEAKNHNFSFLRGGIAVFLIVVIYFEWMFINVSLLQDASHDIVNCWIVT
jgi:cytoskeletal protein RodZ